MSVTISAVGWNLSTNLPSASNKSGYSFSHWIFTSSSYRVSGMTASGSSLEYYSHTDDRVNVDIKCIPIYKKN